MSRRLLIATRNQHKLQEIQKILHDYPVQLISLNDIPPLPEVVEDGESFAENAVKKALENARLSGELTLADDSGLMVDALQGAPGVYSARYSGPDASDESNNQKLLRELKNIPLEERGAQFVCVIAAADPQGKVRTVQGICRGHITYQPCGEGGFGYDPLFIPEGYSCTFAELIPEEKNAISHRGRALRQIQTLLAEWIPLELK
ncbi:MAG TPA: XTP/dITP diphosphatase [Syntrophomonadaceae bacterium]|jgi:XTP/dITP diphosphohydrolase|nr:XTP/dITP diphosphatase [Syntrophomonadaceae bacterium]